LRLVRITTTRTHKGRKSSISTASIVLVVEG
jgi:hypothetical protein